jgi:hypothetical protein
MSPQHIQESLHAELRRNLDHTLHGCCLMSARILCTRLRFLILILWYCDIFSKHRPHRSVFLDALIILQERSPSLIMTPPGTWSAHNLPPHNLSLFKSCDLQVWWIPVSTTMSISCPISIRSIMLKFYVHTSNQFLGTFTPFPSCSSTTSNICPTLNHCTNQANNFHYTPLVQ